MEDIRIFTLSYIFFEQVQWLAKIHSGLFLCPIWNSGFIPPCSIVMRELLEECKTAGKVKPFFFAYNFNEQCIMSYTNEKVPRGTDQLLPISELIELQNLTEENLFTDYLTLDYENQVYKSVRRRDCLDQRKYTYVKR